MTKFIQTNKGQDDLLIKAISHFKIDVPILASRLVGDRIELWLYGGRQVAYPEPDPAPPARAQSQSKKTPSPGGKGKGVR